MSIYIGKDYSAMQGPCDSGYHVPTKDDWTALFNIGVNLGIWSTTSGGTYFLQYLLLPLAGQLSRNEGTPRLQNDSTYYWSCSQWTSNDLAYALGWISDTDIRYNDASLKGIGNPIRPFKDTPVTPDSTWTALYSDKIYHNSTLGLISLSSDGSTWITISDKNLGATQVWNYGDTLSQNNCGNFYQRGNNYGFAFTGAISTSSTQVNAGSYGPGNYYSSSTFITYNNDWSSVTNANIRGGVTGVKPGEVKNIYIGEYGYTPGIYHNTTLGLISLSSDGKNWITIADKNIGASNVGDIGSFFQRGNNYQFPTSGFATSTSSINTSSYGPGNYYSNSIFRYSNMDWSNPSNLNLWGDTTDTSVARQGPCASGYHVASATEWNSLLTVLGTWSLASTGQYLYNYLKMPYAGYINNTNCAYQFNGQIGFYWSSSSNASDGTKGGFLQFSASSMDNNLTSGWWKTLGCKVRPFKNEAVVPDSTWTVIYQPN